MSLKTISVPFERDVDIFLSIRFDTQLLLSSIVFCTKISLHLAMEFAIFWDNPAFLGFMLISFGPKDTFVATVCFSQLVMAVFPSR